MSPLFLLLRNLTLFRHPTLTFFRSLMPCRSPLDLVFVLVFVQEQALLMSALHLRLHSSLALLRALGLPPHLPRRRLWSAPLLTPSRPVRTLPSTPNPACTCPNQSGRWPLGPAPSRLVRTLPPASNPARTCPNRLGRWPLGPAPAQPLRQLPLGLTLRRLFSV
jgi:hypothetical protein